MKSEKFAKIFESEKYGDILVLKGKHDGLHALEVRVCVEGVEAMGYITYNEKADRDFVFDHFYTSDAEKYLASEFWVSLTAAVEDLKNG